MNRNLDYCYYICVVTRPNTILFLFFSIRLANWKKLGQPWLATGKPVDTGQQ